MSVCVESATPYEVKLATSILVQMILPEALQNLIGDNAYDSHGLDGELRKYRIELSPPYRTRTGLTDQADRWLLFASGHSEVGGEHLLILWFDRQAFSYPLSSKAYALH